MFLQREQVVQQLQVLNNKEVNKQIVDILYMLATNSDTAMRMGFERAIRENPRDPTPHRIYADYLEERGDDSAAHHHRAIGMFKQSLDKPRERFQNSNHYRRDPSVTPIQRWEGNNLEDAGYIRRSTPREASITARANSASTPHFLHLRVSKRQQEEYSKHKEAAYQAANLASILTHAHLEVDPEQIAHKHEEAAIHHLRAADIAEEGNRVEGYNGAEHRRAALANLIAASIHRDTQHNNQNTYLSMI